jgi:hypothetical protein
MDKIRCKERRTKKKDTGGGKDKKVQGTEKKMSVTVAENKHSEKKESDTEKTKEGRVRSPRYQRKRC